MTTLSDEQLLTHAERARGKVVVITGRPRMFSIHHGFLCALTPSLRRRNEWHWPGDGIALRELWVRLFDKILQLLLADFLVVGSAKTVIGDWNISGEEKVAEEVRTAGG